MCLSMSMRQSINLRQEQRMDQRMQQKIQMKLELLMSQLVSISREFVFKPKAVCPFCRTRLTESQIIEGFLPDPNDYTTLCPSCETRFVCNLSNPDIELQFLCPDQSLHAIKDLSKKAPEWFKKHEPSAYRSAVYHFGSLKSAFEKLGIRYNHNEDAIWIDKIKDFLGLVSDVKIAESVAQPVSKIRSLRKAYGIERATKNTIKERFFNSKGE